jgi:hypothetical protein
MDKRSEFSLPVDTKNSDISGLGAMGDNNPLFFEMGKKLCLFN